MRRRSLPSGFEQLARRSPAMSSSVTTRTRERFASLTVGATSLLVTASKLGLTRASAEGNAMEYANSSDGRALTRRAAARGSHGKATGQGHRGRRDGSLELIP